MAKLVGCYAAGHAPNIARTWDTMDPVERAWLDDKFGELAKRVKAARPDVLIVHSTDHWCNFFLNNIPAFCIGIGDEHEGPPEPFMKPYFPQETMAGNAKFGKHVLETAFASEFDPSYSMRLKLDHGMVLPIWQIGFDKIPAIVPVYLNLVEKPFATPLRCIKWGHMLRQAIQSYPEDIRVAVIGTGGMSHSIGETTQGWVDEPFDHACIELFRSADDQELGTKIDDMLTRSGNGGAEMRNWLCAHGAAGGGDFELIGYRPMPSMLIGCGVAEWHLAA
jgi:aromatic ring-opening dioxygenase catalytic subunit (LigB family)